MTEQTNETITGSSVSQTDETPDQQPSRQRVRDHTPDAYTVGYDPGGNTRVGIGSANGDVGRLVRLNEGRHPSDGNHSAREAERDKKRITQSFCSVLDVTPHQQREAVWVMGRLNLDRFGRQKRLEKVALGLIQVIVDSDRTRLFFGGRDPAQLDLGNIDLSRYPSPLRDDPRYQALCEQYDITSKDRYSLSQLLKRELKRIGYFERIPGSSK